MIRWRSRAAAYVCSKMRLIVAERVRGCESCPPDARRFITLCCVGTYGRGRGAWGPAPAPSTAAFPRDGFSLRGLNQWPRASRPFAASFRSRGSPRGQGNRATACARPRHLVLRVCDRLSGCRRDRSVRGGRSGVGMHSARLRYISQIIVVCVCFFRRFHLPGWSRVRSLCTVPRMARRMTMPDFRCATCGRTFSMAAHLARHTNAAHGPGRRGKKAAAPKRRKRRKGARKVRRARRKAAGGSRSGLGGMALDDLGQLIVDARAELRRRIAEIEKVML